ncbi:oxidoreductase [Agromyces intestinalis]|uniref:Oxidoreductase n=1 Tax=Agromyces intestinalis TaxID=2592652 RepID=A0A5C1YHH2_9MICO|nr:Gfo/Idh/MocA family oxidoreductase [Agromyces intestinalis]QEO15421.1 oxidoreductase [Agromyces intestinalis]
MARRVGLIGFGLAGRVFHGPLIAAEPALELAAIVTSDPERAADASRRHPGAEIVPDASELLSRDDLDLVVVAAPTPRHLELATRFIEAGFATVVDKPLAVRADDAEQLVSTAESRGVPLTVFQNRRWDGDFLTVRRLVETGELGDVWRFESRFEWISSRPRPEWKSGTPGAEGGGVAYDLGSHLIDQAIRLFGPVADVYGELDVRRDGGVNDDDAFIALTHASGVRSHLAMASLVAQRGFRFRVLGSDSAYTKWGLDPQEAQLAGGMSPLDDGYGVTPPDADGRLGRDGETSPVPTERGGYREFYRGVAAALETGGAMPVDPRDAIEPIRIIEALQARA